MRLMRRFRLLAALAALGLVLAPPARPAAATSPYVLDARTGFYVGQYPPFFDVVSTIEAEPLPESLAALAEDALCVFRTLPEVRHGDVPFLIPITVRFYRLTAAELAAGPPPRGRPFGSVPVAAVHCGEDLPPSGR